MSRGLKIALISLGVLLGIALLMYLIGYPYLLKQTKKASPEQTVTYQKLGLDLEVFYCSPSRKGRTIFAVDGLVPFGEVWRTGANEATTFTTTTDLHIGGKTLPAGKYTLWTQPGADSWEIIFNRKMYNWGVGWGAKAAVDRSHDALVLTIPVQATATTVEQFTIEFLEMEELHLVLKWEDTQVQVPISGV